MIRRIRITISFAAAFLAILAGLDQLKGDWAVWVIAIFGLAIGALNVKGIVEIGGFLISAIGLKLASNAFENIPAIGAELTSILANVEIYISAALLWLAIQQILKDIRIKEYSVSRWVFLAGIALAATSTLEQLSTVDWPIWTLAILGITIGFLEGPKTRSEASEKKGGEFLVSAIALQLSAGALDNIPRIGVNLTSLLDNVVILISAALLTVALMAIFWALDEITK